MNTRSQTATEYLIILAVVIVIALVVIGVLGGIPSIGIGTSENALKATWKTAPISLDWASDPSGTLVSFKNNLAVSIKITSFTLGEKPVNLSLTLRPGDKKKFLHIGVYDFNEKSYTFPVSINYTDLDTNAQYTFQSDDMPIKGKGGSNPKLYLQSQGNQDLFLGLVNWWRFDGNFVDVVGGEDLIPNGDFTFTSDGTINSAAVIDGGANLLVSDKVGVTTYDTYTLSGWIYSSNNLVGSMEESYYSEGADEFASYLNIFEVSTSFRVEVVNNENNCMYIGDPLVKNTWHNFILIKNSASDHDLYIDGVSMTTVLCTGSIIKSNSVEMSTIGYEDPYSIGKLDDYMVFNRALSRSEALQLYQMGR